MTIRWDALLTRHLAAELNDTFSGARLRAIRLDGRTRDVLLFFRDRTLLWRLHPDRGYPLLREAIEPESTDLRLRSRVRSVHAPDDERLLTREKGAGYHELIVEVMGTQMNAIVTEGPERTVRHALRTRDGRRPIMIGHPYLPPPPTHRKGISGDLSSDDWESIVGLIPPADQPKTIVRKIAWTSPLNAQALCDAENGHALWGGWAKALFPEKAWVLASEKGSQPYPVRLPDSEAAVADSLLDAFRIAVEIADQDDAPAALTIGPGLLARLEEAVTRADRRVVRLQAQLNQREEPTQLRATGDLILARYGEIPASATTVTLTNFAGDVIEVALDPALAPHDNAARFYDRAARSERAASRLPGLIEQAITEQDHLHALLSGTRDGSIDASLLKAALPTA
ncbi:MAG: NFACT family protein, partial [Longimicrobiales bacterium]